MTGNSLKSTTAIVIALSLLQPYPAVAQSNADTGTQPAQETPSQTPEEICAEAQILDQLKCDLHIAELEATAAAEAEAQAQAEALAAEEAAAKAEAEAQAAEETDAQAATDDAAEAEATAEAEAQSDVETQAAEETDTQATANDAAEAEATTEAEAQSDAEAQAAEEADTQATTGDAAEAEVTTEAETQSDAEAQAVEEADTQATTGDAAEAEVTTEPETQSDAEAQAVEEADTQATTGDAVEAETTTEAEAQSDAETQAAEETDAQSTADDAAEAEATEEEPLAAEDSPADSTLPIAESDSTQPLAAETDTEASADVTTETVTEETSRSSDEEFETETLAAPDASTQTTAKSKSGMSDLERAGLLALGAAVVGALVLNNKRVEANTGDRVVVVDENDRYQILKDDDALLRQPGSEMRTERFSDGSTRSNVMRADGSEIITIRDATGRVLRRVQVDADRREYLLFDDTRSFEPVVIRDLPEPAVDTFDYQAASNRESLRRALLAADQRDIGRTFSLRQVREIAEVRQLSPEINLQNVTFATASSAIQPSQAEKLREMGLLMRDLIAEDPTELFLIEGYTDAVGAPGYNLLLSDRRAESVALAFSEYFDVPAENMVVQGYGESYLKIPTLDAERLNRRVAVRRITTLVRNAAR